VHLLRSHLEEIDLMISNTSHSYAFERIQSVERNVLRLGVFELFFDPSIPPKVAIAEAMRLARKFGTKESAVFVNAILDTLYKQSIGDQVNKKQLQESAEELSQSEQIAHEASQTQFKNQEETTNDDT
jgi:transcription antitermination protein NusB